MDESTSSPKKKISIELLLGISAVFLSTSALIVSIIQTNILREQQYASVWPHLETLASSKTGHYDYGIENKGVGPAIIKDFEYIYKGSVYNNTNELFLAIFGRNTRGAGFSSTKKDYVFKPGESISLFSVNLPDSLINEIIYRWQSDSVQLKITYSDVYGNCWKLEGDVTTRLSSCPD
ncbi:hypothetical protein [Cesiribacter sp. SM1]|uniref:hypothetical protein n=1 Tax=Cesiribacter sp. SM1 TaxID=2861196 RepID=UPI001CD64628|nr:hypothetical protein [Cesiribacter sp. SM1]